jgi:hypothetical protein
MGPMGLMGRGLSSGLARGLSTFLLPTNSSWRAGCARAAGTTLRISGRSRTAAPSVRSAVPRGICGLPRIFKREPIVWMRSGGDVRWPWFGRVRAGRAGRGRSWGIRVRERGQHHCAAGGITRRRSGRRSDVETAVIPMCQQCNQHHCAAAGQFGSFHLRQAAARDAGRCVALCRPKSRFFVQAGSLHHNGLPSDQLHVSTDCPERRRHGRGRVARTREAVKDQCEERQERSA